MREIQRLLREETKANGEKITPHDIAVLFRSGALAAPLTKALEAAGIPVNNTFRKNLFENPEVLCVYSLLAVIDNPLRDIYLAATLRSPFFDFSLSDLVNIRAAADASFSLYEAVLATAKGDSPLAGKCRAFRDKLNRWRTLAGNLPVDRLLRELYRETSVLSFANKGTAHRTNLERLYEYARSFEANGFQGLYRFVRFVDEMMKSGAEIDEGESGGDAVSVLTIHHSKGLEFPVCFVAGTGSAFSGKDLIPAFLTDATLGCALTLPDAGPVSRCNTFWRRCVAGELAALSREEEMRVLYVALTRARERLIVTGKSRKKAENLESEIAFAADPVSGIFATAGNSFLSWILTALETDGTGTHTRLHFLKDSEIPEIDAADTEEEESRVATISAGEMQERLHFRYPYAHLEKLPAKLSVSRLTPQILDVFDTDGAPSPEDLLSPDAEQLLRSFDRPFAPEPENKVPTAAERGTATHEFLQFCNLAKAKNDVGKELERLIALGFLPESARDAVQKEELAAFFESSFYTRLSKAQRIWRETRFNIFLPAREFTKDEAFATALGEEKLLVQGVIDLFFEDEDGKLILCDYKTDRLSPYELSHHSAAAQTLFDRHRQQLSYYRKAITQIAEHAPDETLIYSLPAGTAFADPQGETEV